MNPARLKSKMQELKLSAAKLSELSDVSESTIKRALSGSRPNSTNCRMLAHALGVDVDWLIEPADAPIEPPNEPIEPTNEPISEPTEPVTELEKPDMMTLIDAIERAYISRVEELKLRIEDMKEREAYMKREKRIDRVFSIALVAFICLLFAYDILNPNAGWFRY